MLHYRLKKRVRFQRLVNRANAFGEIVPEYVEYVTVWAEIIPVSGDESYARVATAETARITHNIRFRALPGLSTKDRIQYRDRLFEIRSIIDEEEKNRTMIAECSEIAR